MSFWPPRPIINPLNPPRAHTKKRKRKEELFPIPSLFSVLFSLSLSCFTNFTLSMAVPVLMLVLFFLSLLVNGFLVVQGTSWCVARSDATNQALQTSLDYACSSGADCSPIQSSGLCFLPNTIQAHASYAFNSYYQLRAMAPGSCDFVGTATVAQTDPSLLFPFNFLSFFWLVFRYGFLLILLCFSGFVL